MTLHLCLAAMVGVVVLASPAVADLAQCAALHERLPRDLDGWSQAQLSTYTAGDNEGFFAQYTQGPNTLSVYFFDRGLPQIDLADVEAEFEGALWVMTQSQEALGQAMLDVGAFVDPQGTIVRFIGGGVDTSTQAQLVSLGQHRDCLVKLRLTYQDPATAFDQFEILAADLTEALPAIAP